MSQLLHRARGVLWGQAVGDALGTTVEFQSPGQVAAKYPKGLRAIEGGGPFSVEPGQVTDDTELALCLARSLSARGRFDEEDVVRRYIAWCLANPPDCGGTTRRAFGKAVDPSVLAAPVARARAFTDSQANGALMRISPLAVFGWNLSPEALAEFAAADASLSHPHEACVAANQVFTFAIAYALRTGALGPAVFDATLAFARGTRSMTEAIPTLELARHELPLDATTNMGWVRLALQCAFHQLLHARDFEQALGDVIALGGDTDTNACITGALLGAVVGVDAIPQRWIETVRRCQPQQRPKELWCGDLDARRPAHDTGPFDRPLNRPAPAGSRQLQHMSRTGAVGQRLSTTRPRDETSPKQLALRRHWLRTPNKEVGMGQTPGMIPGHGEAPPVGRATEWIEHSTEKEKACEVVPDVDAACVERETEFGTSTGEWFPFTNDCHTVTQSVLDRCSTRPKNQGPDFGDRSQTGAGHSL